MMAIRCMQSQQRYRTVATSRTYILKHGRHSDRREKKIDGHAEVLTRCDHGEFGHGAETDGNDESVSLHAAS
jgi:hypothetical protein